MLTACKGISKRLLRLEDSVLKLERFAKRQWPEAGPRLHRDPISYSQVVRVKVILWRVMVARGVVDVVGSLYSVKGSSQGSKCLHIADVRSSY